MNEFLKNLNVVSTIKNIISLVETRQYQIQNLVHFEAAFEEVDK